MTDKPTPTTDLLKRCAEIHEWRSTGLLSGEALRDYAKRKWPDLHDTLQMAEHETVTEALALLAKWGQPAQATEPVARLEIESLKAQLHAAKQINAAQFGLLAASIPGSALRASHGQAPATQQVGEPECYKWEHYCRWGHGWGWGECESEYDPRLPENKQYHTEDFNDPEQVRNFRALYRHTPPSLPTAQADSVPAVEREQERIAFKDAHRHLELYEVPDAWGRPMFKHSHVEASWLGWIARALYAAPQPSPKAAPVTQQAGYAEVIECGNSYAKVKLKGEAFGSARVGDIFYTAPQPAPAPLSEMPYEKRKAIQEGEQISASDAWFKARHEMLDTLDRRNVFRAGFDRGWNAAIAAQGEKGAG